MFRSLISAGLTVMALSSPVSAAQTHQVLITGVGFFPLITYLRPGDTVVFQNVAQSAINVIAVDDDGESVDWATGAIPPNQYFSVVVAEESLLEFEMNGSNWINGESEHGSSEGHWETFTSPGSFTFDNPRLN